MFLGNNSRLSGNFLESLPLEFYSEEVLKNAYRGQGIVESSMNGETSSTGEEEPTVNAVSAFGANSPYKVKLECDNESERRVNHRLVWNKNEVIDIRVKFVWVSNSFKYTVSAFSEAYQMLNEQPIEIY